MSFKVAILGAGPSGLAQLRTFEAARDTDADIPEFVCYENTPYVLDECDG